MEHDSSLRKFLLLLTTAAAALGVTLGLPMKKAVAAPRDTEMAPSPMMRQAPARLVVIQPRYVNPTAAGLIRLADRALSDERLAQRIFREPDAVAMEFHLSNAERLVLRHMDAEQFQVARTDAARLVADRVSRGAGMRMPPGATDARLITERMIVGRAILAAVGRSYLDAADAHACCPWSKAIELGINSDPAYFNAAFARPAMQ
jgi:hypothetical protein